MGHDWGGLLSWQLALFHPRRVQDVVSFYTPHVPHWVLWLHPALVDPVLPEGRSFGTDPRKDTIAQMREVFSPDIYVLMFQNGHAADDMMNPDPRATLCASLRKDPGGPEGWPDLPMSIKNMEYCGQPASAKLLGRDVLTPEELDVYVRHQTARALPPRTTGLATSPANGRVGFTSTRRSMYPR